MHSGWEIRYQVSDPIVCLMLFLSFYFKTRRKRGTDTVKRRESQEEKAKKKGQTASKRKIEREERERKKAKREKKKTDARMSRARKRNLKNKDIGGKKGERQK